jgi:hypothetical protein
MGTILDRSAGIFPPIRRLIASRDAALAERDEAFAARDVANAATLRRVLGVASPDTYPRASLNGSPLWLPVTRC